MSSEVKVQSLRYGSIVHYKGRTCTVGTIHGGSSLYLYDIKKLGEKQPIVCAPSDIRGIRADSIKVLRKIGFVESGVYKNYEYGPISFNPAQRAFYFNEVEILYKMHVHQLQNLAYDWMETDRMLFLFETYKEQK